MSGRHLAPHATTEALFRACKALDFSAMSQALDDGADIHAMDERWRYPLGVFIEAWRTGSVLPDPSPFVHLLARHGANLARPEGGAGSLHTMGWLRGTDDEVAFFDALVDCGMTWNDMADDGELLTRVVRHRAPRMLSRILQGPFDVSPDALDQDEQTALHALVDARLHHHHRPRDDRILEMMSTLLDAGASDALPDIWGRTAPDRFRDEAPDLQYAWSAMKAEHLAALEKILLDEVLPQANFRVAHDESTTSRRRL
jgi:hypothetical protein